MKNNKKIHSSTQKTVCVYNNAKQKVCDYYSMCLFGGV